MKTLLKGGVVASLQGEQEADVLIGEDRGKGRKIEEISFEIEASGDVEVIDCSGKHILPGAIDVHVHFREPGHTHKEDFGTGTRAAVSGGVTTVFDMPNTNPPTSTGELVEAKYGLARAKSVAHVGLYALAVPNTIEEVLKLDNIVGIKIYLGASTGGHQEEVSFLEQIFRKAQEIGPIATEKIIVVHAEDGACIARHAKEFEGQNDPSIHSKIRAAECATMSTRAVCHLAKKYDARVHIAHMSTAEEVEILREFKSNRITCEVTPHHLFLNEDYYADLGNKMRVNPPVRTNKDTAALWQAIHDGIVDIVATDHAPHTLEEKAKDYFKAPSGMPGVETMLPLLLNEVNAGNLSLQDLVKLTSHTPAKLFNLSQKGQIKAGFDADLVVVDMQKEGKIENSKQFTKCGWSPFDGKQIKGWPVMTFVDGNLVYKDGKILGEAVASTIF